MLATVALLACFAVVVMPSLFTVAPDRRAGLPSPSDSAPQAAVSAPVERKKLQRTNAPHAFSGIFASRRPARGRYHSSFSCAASGAGAGGRAEATSRPADVIGDARLCGVSCASAPQSAAASLGATPRQTANAARG